MEMIKDSEKEEIEPIHATSPGLFSDPTASTLSPRTGMRTLKKSQQQNASVLRSPTPRWSADKADTIKQQFTIDGAGVTNSAQSGDSEDAHSRRGSDLADGLLVLLTETFTELAKWTDPVSEKDVLTVYVEHESRKGRPAIALQALLKQLDGLDAKSTTKAHLAARNQLISKLGWEHAVSANEILAKYPAAYPIL